VDSLGGRDEEVDIGPAVAQLKSCLVDSLTVTCLATAANIRLQWETAASVYLHF
jgi:hypothetical protein